MGIDAIRTQLADLARPGNLLERATFFLPQGMRNLSAQEVPDYTLDQVSIITVTGAWRLIDIINAPEDPWTHEYATFRSVLISLTLLQQIQWIERATRATPPPIPSPPEPRDELYLRNP